MRTSPPVRLVTRFIRWWYQTVTRGRMRSVRSRTTLDSGSENGSAPGVEGVERPAPRLPAEGEVAVEVDPAAVLAPPGPSAVGVHVVDQPQLGAAGRTRAAQAAA